MTSVTDDLDDEFDDFEDFDDEERGVSGLVVLLVILAMLAVFSFIVWLAYNKGLRDRADAGNVPYVSADPEPVKTRIDEPVETASVDREVYDRLDGNAPARPEVMDQGAEEPITTSVDQIAIIAAEAERDGLDAVDTADDEINRAADAARSSVAEATAGRTRDGDAMAALIEENAGDSQVGEAPSNGGRGATPPTRTSASGATARSTASEPAQRTQSTVSTSAAASGTHVVQVAAFRSRDEADRFWSRLQERFGTYMDGKAKDIERADLGAKGIYYRLRIAGFDSKDAAASYCNGLKARDQDCLVKAR